MTFEQKVANDRLKKVIKQNSELFKMRGIKKKWIIRNNLFINYDDCLGVNINLKFKIRCDDTVEHVQGYKHEEA